MENLWFALTMLVWIFIVFIAAVLILGVKDYNEKRRLEKEKSIDSKYSAEGNLQMLVDSWMQNCFGKVIAVDKTERNYRFTEEALELVQACGMSRADAHTLVDYVYDRQIGEKTQEVGGVVVTLAALCTAQGINLMLAAYKEIERIADPAVMQSIRIKQANKPNRSPLPQ